MVVLVAILDRSVRGVQTQSGPDALFLLAVHPPNHVPMDRVSGAMGVKRIYHQ